ncbi:MAG: phosphoglycerate kinase [Candidatus Taylorbacteria bacterium RIFCSPLOWO2_12_FULL_43_20]|uniref:Phosphoglycerate kinase n=1 Tax=Candidatus Taylorbacteria bacterium RIFCSPLOWO2_12_FULL_43_20 TaxID=1802332 RepID=A0A1G2P1W4_9BACT|nr:MAG: phosphoglycerate kinase [Candidatus Taylorbacteria bacterium RIFCSPHIGHO2_01_FULL_43_120]OHA23655.1 MAG: phosphoglycerate kinase [Candidatus Taylorbacteria bacterium RIFCSPHIGHO2_02_FULL_43_55]OHA28130.1 MAG: phosphoglycerate kinase [Candidatus Taylorbacteria bacterium RIFCSPHIGHO2_12_FULL_42_34]OHA32343.1 MAG: phosphoglycerate kinase [Candidatus Taylorbacteria bacterium RIFCSPLOWO2_01_FULL_43_83]OHA37680.1 MAG: phosphoglycerate kinase [Candidatus Taylorbacteria bacterium RIFCSPLOWO2_02
MSKLPLLSRLKSSEIKGKIIFLRLDLNVSILQGKISDDFRLVRIIPTIEYIRSMGGKIIIGAHMESEGMETLEEVHHYLNAKLPVKFIKVHPRKLDRSMFDAMRDGEIALLENLRRDEGEKSNDESFSRHLAGLADVYVNDAFSSSHREHASIVGVPRFIPGYMGLLFEEEYNHMSRCRRPKKPYLAIVGGAKFETKFALVKKLLVIADNIFLCGALANDVYRRRGMEIGRSFQSESNINLDAIMESKKVSLPTDALVEDIGDPIYKNIEEVKSDEMIVDSGPESLEVLRQLVSEARFILWNGPLGLYEKGYTDATLKTAKMILESGAESVMGGGDTLTAISKIKAEVLGEDEETQKRHFLSTGGGAMLEFLASGTLAGIKALSTSTKH